MANRLSFLGSRGNEISVLAAGSQSGNDPAMILIHGFPLDARLWRSQLSGLSANHHVIALEMRGFGQSSLGDAAYSLADLADDVELVRQHLAGEQPIVLCGLSMGGYVAFEYWSKYRENLTALILANTKPTADNDETKAVRMAMGEQAIREGTWAAVKGMLPKLISEATSAIRPESVSETEMMMRSLNPSTIAAAQAAMANRRDFSGKLAEIDLPTLIVTGELDPIAPPTETRVWSSLIKDSSLSIIPSAGHLTPLESPHEFNRLVQDFLRTLPQPRG